MIPVFGWCLYLLKNISINRTDGKLTKKNNGIMWRTCSTKQSAHYLSKYKVPYGASVKLKKEYLK